MSVDTLCDATREITPVNRQSATSRQGSGLGAFEQQRPEPAELRLQQAGGAVGEVRSERVGAHQLRELGRRVGTGRDIRPHLVQFHVQPAFSRLPGGFAPCKASADDDQVSHNFP
jgi:hypothetical protein